MFDMSSNVVTCQRCQTKNRLRAASASELPRCGSCQAELPWLVDADQATFNQEINAPVPVLVDFWAPWCGPCKAVAPVLDELSRELAGRLKVVKVNVDHNPQLAQRFRVQGIPMLALFDGGELRDTIVGAQPKSALMRTLTPYL
jgi:thioredoxin 2